MSNKYIMYNPVDFRKAEITYANDADELTRLRADLAAVTAERDRMREALKLALEYWKHRQSRYKNRHPVWVQTARAALEGVTEPASPWRDIESAPRDGTWIFIYKDSWHGAIKAKWSDVDDVDGSFKAWVFQDEFLCVGVAEGCLGYNEDIEDGNMPSHWTHTPSPPR